MSFQFTYLDVILSCAKHGLLGALLCTVSLISLGEENHPLNLPYLAEYPDKYGFNPHAAQEDSIFFAGPDSFYFPNDAFSLLLNEDENFSFGIGWNWSDSLARKHILHTDLVQRKILSYFELNSSYSESQRLQFGLIGFTPGICSYN